MQSDNETDLPPANDAQGSCSAGKALKQAREAQAKTVVEVAGKLFVRPQLIDAIERDDYSPFSARVYVVGLLRSYARLLDIPAGPLLEAINVIDPCQEPALTAVNQSVKAVRSVPAVSLGMVSLVLVLLVALAIFLFLSADEELVGQPQTPPVASLMSPGSQTPDDPISMRGDMLPLPDVSTAVAAISQSGQEITPDGPASVRLAETGASATVAAAVPRKARVPVLGRVPEQKILDAILLLTFETDSWAEVHDANGRRLLTRTGHAGQQLRLTGRAPFDIRLGYAPGVRIDYNGKPYDQGRKSGSRVAHFQVGLAP